MSETYRLGDLAHWLGAELRGDPELRIAGIQTLADAGSEDLGFLANPLYRSQLAVTRAAAVLVAPDMVQHCPVATIVTPDPYLAYARLSHRFERRPRVAEGVHPTAFVDPSASLGPGVRIGPHVAVEADVVLEAGVELGAGTVVGAGCQLGRDSRLAPRVTLYPGVTLGARTLIQSGAVLGSDGFGFAPDTEGGWQKIAQLGGVEVGDDVEIGANTTIDRGALQATRIGAGVKIDNQVQIGHNCVIGEQTAIAGCVGIAGSTRIGRRCTLAGGAGIAGHLDIADEVHISGMAMVTRSIREKGVYSSGTGISAHSQWKRNVVRFRQLDRLASRVAALEASAQEKHKG